jgi:hypothetical protein
MFMIRRLLTTTLVWLALLTVASAQSYSLRIKEVDGTPNQPNVRTIVVSNGTLSCTGSTCTITTGGGGGTPGGSNKQLQVNASGSFGGATGYEYDATADWTLKAVPASGKTGMVLYEPGSTPPATVRGAPAMLHVHVANGNTYWGIGYTNTAAGGTGWANYMADDASLFFTNTNLVYQFDNAGFKWFKSSATYYGTIGETSSDHFSAGVSLTTPAAMIPEITWSDHGVGINKSTSIGAQLHVVSGDNARVAGLINSAASPSADIFQVQKNGTNMFRITSTGLPSVPQAGAHVVTNTTQSITANTLTTVTFHATEWDTNSFWTGGAPTHIKFATAGKYQVTVQTSWNNPGNGIYIAQARLNGLGTPDDFLARDFRGLGAGASIGVATSFSFIINAAANDYIEIEVYQNSGAPVNLSGSAGIQSPACRVWVTALFN